MGLGTKLWLTWLNKNNTQNRGGNFLSIFLSPADDATRVLLQGNEDYINASYVNVSWDLGDEKALSMWWQA